MIELIHAGVTLVLAIASGLIAFGALLGLVLGVGLLVAPAKTERLQAMMNRRFSLRRAMKPLEIPRPKERAFYRHHRIWGTGIVLGATIYILTWSLMDAKAINALAPNPFGVDRWLFDSAEIFLTVGNFLALAVGLIVFFRPSLLKRVESTANHWVSSRRWLKGLERETTAADMIARKRPRLVASLLIAGSLFVLISFGSLWLGFVT
ncbi:MAG: hypothetical protein PVG21_05300 [Gammaproteobacteria bacterium]|jgi:hypothetical protein